MATKDFVVFDGDSHVVEPLALWEKYLDPEYRTLGKYALWRQEGRTGAYLTRSSAPQAHKETREAACMVRM